MSAQVSNRTGTIPMRNAAYIRGRNDYPARWAGRFLRRYWRGFRNDTLRYGPPIPRMEMGDWVLFPEGGSP